MIGFWCTLNYSVRAVDCRRCHVLHCDTFYQILFDSVHRELQR